METAHEQHMISADFASMQQATQTLSSRRVTLHPYASPTQAWSRTLRGRVCQCEATCVRQQLCDKCSKIQ